MRLVPKPSFIALDEFGRIDVLIHNAGIVEGTFEQLDEVNFRVAVWLTEAAWEHKVAQQYGRVLLTTSSAGLFGASNGVEHAPIQSYGATKMGAFGLWRCLAVRGRSCNIRVNMVSPHAFTRWAAGLPPSPQAKFVQTYSKPELVAPGSVLLVHETWPVGGETFAVGAGRMARIVVGETVGYVDLQLTVEKVAQNFAKICDETGYHVPVDMSAIVDIYRRVVRPTRPRSTTRTPERTARRRYGCCRPTPVVLAPGHRWQRRRSVRSASGWPTRAIPALRCRSRGSNATCSAESHRLWGRPRAS
jgi:NAD(P)-dependent dehydrogenase (short-subunit alcohol dehydrogenase family)